MSTLPVRFARVPVPRDQGTCLALAGRWLSTAELAACPSRAVAKRRAEFVAGRIAAKIALARHGGTKKRSTIPTIGIETGHTSGRPVAVDGRRVPIPDVSLSITHSDGWAVACAGGMPLGIDLVPVEDRGGGFVGEAFAPGEVEAWTRWLPEPVTAAVAQSIAFSAKEAVLKWCGVGLRMGLRELVASPLGPHEWVSCRDLAVDSLAFQLRVELRAAPQPAGHVRGRRVLRAWLMRIGDQVLLAVTSP